MAEKWTVLLVECTDAEAGREFDISGNFSRLNLKEMERVFSWLQIELGKKIHERYGQEALQMQQAAKELNAKDSIQ